MLRQFFIPSVLILLSLPGWASEVDNLMQQTLADIPRDAEVLMQTVSYEPGEASAPHRHDAHVFVYALEGSVRMQVQGGEITTLNPGDVFYESPDDVHVLSENASRSAPATFLVVMIKTEGAPALVPVGED